MVFVLKGFAVALFRDVAGGVGSEAAGSDRTGVTGVRGGPWFGRGGRAKLAFLAASLAA